MGILCVGSLTIFSEISELIITDCLSLMEDKSSDIAMEFDLKSKYNMLRIIKNIICHQEKK